MAIAVGNPKLDAKMAELRALRTALAQVHFDPMKRRRQKARLLRLQAEIRHLLAQ